MSRSKALPTITDPVTRHTDRTEEPGPIGSAKPCLSIRKHHNTCLEHDAKHLRVVLVQDVLDEIHELGTKHLLDAGAGRAIVDALGGSTFDRAPGFGE